MMLLEYVFSHVNTFDFTSILGPLPMNPERPAPRLFDVPRHYGEACSYQDDRQLPTSTGQ